MILKHRINIEYNLERKYRIGLFYQTFFRISYAIKCFYKKSYLCLTGSMCEKIYAKTHKNIKQKPYSMYYDVSDNCTSKTRYSFLTCNKKF